MELQKTPHSQSNFEKEKQSWMHHNSTLQVILQNRSDQNSMVLAQKETQRSTEQNREPKNEPTIIWSINLLQRRQEYAMGKKKTVSSPNGIEKTRQLHAKELNWITFFHHTQK